LIGSWGSVHIGASGILFGYLVYLVIRGVVSRNPWQILLGVVVFLVYGSVLWGVLPGNEGISWQMHFFGAVGGALAAWWFAKPVRRQPRGLDCPRGLLLLRRRRLGVSAQRLDGASHGPLELGDGWLRDPTQPPLQDHVVAGDDGVGDQLG